MKRFKVASDNENKLLTSNSNSFMSKLAATPPNLPPPPKIIVKDLHPGLIKAMKLHGGELTDVNKLVAGAGGIGSGLAIVNTVIQALNKTTNIGSLIAPALIWMGAAWSILGALSPKLKKSIAMKFKDNTLFQNFDTTKYPIKKFADITKLKGIDPNPPTVQMTLKEMAESMKGFPEDVEDAWAGGENGPYYMFQNPSDAEAIKIMIQKNASAESRYKFMTALLAGGIPVGYGAVLGIDSIIRSSVNAKRRETPQAKSVVKKIVAPGFERNDVPIEEKSSMKRLKDQQNSRGR